VTAGRIIRSLGSRPGLAANVWKRNFENPRRRSFGGTPKLKALSPLHSQSFILRYAVAAKPGHFYADAALVLSHGTVCFGADQSAIFSVMWRCGAYMCKARRRYAILGP